MSALRTLLEDMLHWDISFNWVEKQVFKLLGGVVASMVNVYQWLKPWCWKCLICSWTWPCKGKQMTSNLATGLCNFHYWGKCGGPVLSSLGHGVLVLLISGQYCRDLDMPQNHFCSRFASHISRVPLVPQMSSKTWFWRPSPQTLKLPQSLISHKQGLRSSAATLVLDPAS